MTDEEIRHNETMMCKILKMVQDKDPLFMYLSDDIITDFVVKDYILIDPNKENDMSGTTLTKRGEHFLNTNAFLLLL
jgi:hypothetical protein